MHTDTNKEWNDLERDDRAQVDWHDILWAAIGAFVAVLAAWAIVSW